METKRIQCPKCHGLLEVTNPKGDPVLLITCPKPDCGAKMRITFDTGDTILADAKPHEDAIGHLAMGSRTFALAEGTNTVGRKSTSSNATIQLPTDDRSMSRQHAQIEVTRLKNGRVKAVLTDLREADKICQLPTRIDDEPLLPGDAFVLENGDAITMGQTEVKYVI